jgi:hypothetical protein
LVISCGLKYFDHAKVIRKIGGKLMAKHSKFIQIATASETVRSGQVKPILFALDEEENVWEYDYIHESTKGPNGFPCPPKENNYWA